MTLEQDLLSDIEWEERMRQQGIVGWELTRLFLERLKEQAEKANVSRPLSQSEDLLF